MLKRISRHLSSMRGFTMIELLVVIAIIGVLAVAVLSAINPIEQINKGRDTRTRSDAAELLGSVERYYSTQELYPWEMTSADATYPWTAGALGALVYYGDAADEFNWLSTLTSSQEVKAQFSQRLLSAYSNPGATPEFVLVKAADGAGIPAQPVYVCFMPSSQQFKLEATRKCCAAEDAGGVCANAGEIVNTAPAAVGAFDPCEDRAGDITATNYICLP